MSSTMSQAGLEWLLHEEYERRAKVLAHCFGYYLLELSAQANVSTISCPIKQHIVAKPEQSETKAQEYVVADWVNLPFSPDSMDVILMSHVFDWFNNTDALLKEVSTVLRHDGKLIVTGFSSGRFRARSLAKCYLTKPIRLKLCSSVMLLLQNAGFEICEVRHYGFFAIKNKILAKYINAFCNRILPAMACGYMIVAQKKVLSAIAEKPEWPKPLLDPKKITVPTYRVKNKHE